MTSSKEVSVGNDCSDYEPDDERLQEILPDGTIISLSSQGHAALMTKLFKEGRYDEIKGLQEKGNYQDYHDEEWSVLVQYFNKSMDVTVPKRFRADFLRDIKSELILDAISFASRKHNGQFRKDGLTPYVSHPMRVMTILSSVFGVVDSNILVAAVLHDVIEDTATCFDDIKKEFGDITAVWVGLLSKDQRQKKEIRELSYLSVLRNAPDEVKLIKLADIYDNLMDASSANDPEQSAKTRKKSEKYLQVFSGKESAQVLKAIQQVTKLLNKADK